MSRVNLLPWRRARRQRRQREFLAMLAAAALAGLGVVAVWQALAMAMLGRQQDRNDLLRRETAVLDERIHEIKDLQAQKAKLQARMDVIQALQVKRPLSVRLFDALARSTPDGVFLTGVAQRDATLSLQGWAQSNARVSTFMHQLDACEIFDASTLLVARAGEHRGMPATQFELRVPLRPIKEAPAP